MADCRVMIAAGCALVLAACQPGGTARVDAEQSEPYSGIAADEVLYFGGNEPFWGGQVASGSLTYTTPEDPDGEVIEVTRFAGMNGLGFNGQMVAGAQFDMAVTPGECSDTMSDRSYPFVVTLSIADEVRNGCGWTDKMPYTGDANP